MRSRINCLVYSSTRKQATAGAALTGILLQYYGKDVNIFKCMGSTYARKCIVRFQFIILRKCEKYYGNKFNYFTVTVYYYMCKKSIVCLQFIILIKYMQYSGNKMRMFYTAWVVNFQEIVLFFPKFNSRIKCGVGKKGSHHYDATLYK